MRIIHVAIDEHKLTLRVVALRDRILADEQLPNEPVPLKRFLDRLARQGKLRVCYEAGGGGYALQRQLSSWGYWCEVIAPSLTPIHPGEPRKTDQRDARKLAQLYRAGLLTPVHVPDAGDERVRDLIRCRETLGRNALRARHYVLKLLRRQGMIYHAGKHWTQRHWQWLRRVQLPDLAQEVLDEYLTLLEFLLQRMSVLDRRIEAIAASDTYCERIAPLQAYRGISIHSAMVLASEVGDFRRFATPQAFMAYAGLVPGERSSGEQQRRGPITKTGNARIRHVLVQAAWHYRHRPARSRLLRQRQEGLPPATIAHALHAQRRLHRRFQHLAFRKSSQKAVVAVARELAGFLWAAMLPPSARTPGRRISRAQKGLSTAARHERRTLAISMR